MDWYGPDKATFGDRLVAAREKANLSQQDLAKRLGVKNSTIKSWENDNSEPRANRLSMLAGLLNVSITWLISAEGSGVEAPEKSDEMSNDLLDALKELTALRVNLLKNIDRINNIEKKLRASGKLN
ncbi:MAG: helix-turn-helix transcriptional regulator [Paracoccaceae bacterium]|jgi:transcriptional regulator with XRE-family HTH domain|nr:helix-turn-helix transcriptional regulator [Paracoccaceae bacterium]MDG2249110.1 helix-turn-helix transcriptional regulator [Paracoccaceae bacterium]|tara:strand:- start:63 stop:440 length:378 start_codon:yes stop_codon:yes gene_type:complete